MSKKILPLLMALLSFAFVAYAADKPFVLVIDPGHGGHDPGALGSSSKEKNINLSVSLAFGKYVEANCPDVKVVYTRKTDVFIPLMERANIANRNNANLFISIHTNSLGGGKIARGFETYTLGMHRADANFDVAKRENSVIELEKGYQKTYHGFDPNSSESYIMFEFVQGKFMEQSVELAKMIQRNVCSLANRADKGVHQAGFLVLRETSMPSCLIELGFITTPDEERSLNNSVVIDNIAKGIYNAFAQYKNKYDTHVVVPYKTEYNEQISAPAPPPAESKQAKAQEKSEQQAPKETQSKPEPPVVKPTANEAEPVFKVQILSGSQKLKASDPVFKNLKGVENYTENGTIKYTVGASNNYNEISRLRKSILPDFPEAFIIAFKNGQKMDVNAAIREFLKNKNK